MKRYCILIGWIEERVKIVHGKKDWRGWGLMQRVRSWVLIHRWPAS
jgi:hypothetical protein